MFDPIVGEWFEEDPIIFHGGDSNLRRYVGNSATNATDLTGLFPSVLELVRANFESYSGVANGLKNGTLRQDPLTGKSVECVNYRIGAEPRKRGEKCTLTFTFDRAYKGSWYYPRFERRVNGVYVNIAVSAKVKYDGDYAIRLITLARLTKKEGDSIVSQKPEKTNQLWLMRGGWIPTESNSHLGWMVDTAGFGKQPAGTPYGDIVSPMSTIKGTR